jgi:hypothetical protein
MKANKSTTNSIISFLHIDVMTLTSCHSEATIVHEQYWHKFTSFFSFVKFLRKYLLLVPKKLIIIITLNSKVFDCRV